LPAPDSGKIEKRAYFFYFFGVFFNDQWYHPPAAAHQGGNQTKCAAAVYDHLLAFYGTEFFKRMPNASGRLGKACHDCRNPGWDRDKTALRHQGVVGKAPVIVKACNFHMLAEIFAGGPAVAASAAGVSRPDGKTVVVFIKPYEFVPGNPRENQIAVPLMPHFSIGFADAAVQDPQALETLFHKRRFVFHCPESVYPGEYQSHFEFNLLKATRLFCLESIIRLANTFFSGRKRLFRERQLTDADLGKVFGTQRRNMLFDNRQLVHGKNACPVQPAECK
jgi:hypothetical protein